MAHLGEPIRRQIATCRGVLATKNLAFFPNSKKRNVLTGGSPFFAPSPFCETKSTDCTAKTVAKMEFVSPWGPPFSVRRNRPIREVWTDGRADGSTDRRNFVKCIFRNPLLQTKSNRNGGGKNSRAFRLARTASIPAVNKIRK